MHPGTPPSSTAFDGAFQRNRGSPQARTLQGPPVVQVFLRRERGHPGRGAASGRFDHRITWVRVAGAGFQESADESRMAEGHRIERKIVRVRRGSRRGWALTSRVVVFAAGLGPDRVRAVLIPVDFRRAGIEEAQAAAENSPEWLGELYAELAGIVGSLSDESDKYQRRRIFERFRTRVMLLQ